MRIIIKHTRYLLEAVGVLLLWGILVLLGRKLSGSFGSFLAVRMGKHTRYHQIAKDNIEKVFPAKAGDQEFLNEIWSNFGRTVAEYPHLTKIYPESVKIVGEYPKSTRPVVYFSAHLANWEIMGVLGAKLEKRKLLMAQRPQNNIWVRAIVSLWRSKAHIVTVPKGRTLVREFSEVLRKNGAIAVLIDQRDRGDTIRFFNRPALVNTLVASLALKHNALVVPTRIARINNEYTFTIEPPLKYPRNITPLALTQKMYERIEEWITQTPSQWLWFHRRWLISK